jgi:glycosyltransferase involved in cell wall biosynthesis
VLIPCYNDVPGLVQALQSIQYDTGTFAVIIIDDGSPTPLDRIHLLRSAPQIKYLHLIHLSKNEGITTALNTGLQWILQNTNAPYIARLDCGDTCHPQRFQKQVIFLNAHTQVGLLGSWCTFREEGTGRSYTYTTPLQHPAIIKAMHLRNVFIHPAVMFRTALLKDTGLYPYAFPHAEDYAFFWKLLQVTQGAILSEILMCCVIRQSGISFANRRKQLWSRGKVVRAFGSSVVLKVIGMLKLYILLLMPNALLLRLKTGRAAV